MISTFWEQEAGQSVYLLCWLLIVAFRFKLHNRSFNCIYWVKRKKKHFERQNIVKNVSWKERDTSLRIQMSRQRAVPHVKCYGAFKWAGIYYVHEKGPHDWANVANVLASCDMHQCLSWWNPLMVVCSVTDFFVPQLDIEIHKDQINDCFLKRDQGSINFCLLPSNSFPQIKPVKWWAYCVVDCSCQKDKIWFLFDAVLFFNNCTAQSGLLHLYHGHLS